MSKGLELLAKRMAEPKRFRVTTTYDNGKTRTYDAATLKQAENHTKLYRPNINRELIDRDSGDIVRIVSVAVSRI